MSEMAHRLDTAGADGLVLFNRFMQPDIDPETLKVTPSIELSTAAEARLPRAWIAQLAGRVNASLAASTGVESAGDVTKYLLAGADVVMTASALLRHGPSHAQTLLDGLTSWMSHRGFADLAAMRGLLSVPVGANESRRERASYVSSVLQADLGYGAW
jgi:dihydroorotate dehydrogenase (fumarate)